jgi:hypothetical protein
MEEASKYLISLHKGIVVINMKEDAGVLSEITDLKDYVLIQVREDIYTYIMKEHPTYLVDLNYILYEDPMLSIVRTIKDNLIVEKNDYIYHDLLENLPSELAKEFKRISNISKTFCSNYKYNLLAHGAQVKEESYTKELCIKFNNYMKGHRAAQTITASCGNVEKILVAAVVMKTKAYRLNYNVYKRIKNNKLLNILCKK